MKRYIVKVIRGDVTIEILCKNRKDAIETASHEKNNGGDIEITKN